MREKKYMNNRSYNNIDKYNIKIINKQIKSPEKQINKIISINSSSEVLRWDLINNKISIYGQVTYKILYLSKESNNIYLVRDKSYVYSEIDIGWVFEGEKIEFIKERKGISVGCNIQDCGILKITDDYINIAATLLSWTDIVKIPSVILNIEVESKKSYLYCSNQYFKNIKQLTYSDNVRYKSIAFSNKGDEIFFIEIFDDGSRYLKGLQIRENISTDIISGKEIIDFIPFGLNSLIVLDFIDGMSSLRVVSVRTRKSKYIIKDMDMNIIEMTSNKDKIVIIGEKHQEYKLLLFDSNGTGIFSLSGEYSKAKITVDGNKIVAIKDNCINIIDIKTKELKRCKINYLNIIDYKFKNPNAIIIKGKWEQCYYLIEFDLRKIKQRVILEIEHEIGDYFVNNNKEITLTYKCNKRWYIKKVDGVEGNNELVDINGKRINIVVRGEWWSYE